MTIDSALPMIFRDHSIDSSSNPNQSISPLGPPKKPSRDSRWSVTTFRMETPPNAFGTQYVDLGLHTRQSPSPFYAVGYPLRGRGSGRLDPKVQRSFQPLGG